MKKNNAIILFGLTLIFTLGLINFAFSAEKSSGKKKKSSNKSGDVVIAEVGDSKITYDELEKAFKKNMNRKDINLHNISRDSISDFLNLYVNYRLKVVDAVKRGFDKDSAVMADIAQNRKILAETYFYDKKLVEPHVNEMLDRRQREIQIAIILISRPTTPGADTTKSYNKAKACLELIKKGKSFADVAKDSSDDKESAPKGGFISTYITAGNVLRPVEDAIYSTKAGETYPELIMTRGAYFIVKVVSNEPRVKVKGSQILITDKDRDSVSMVRKADSMLSLIKKGADFGKLAEENSEDPNSAVKKGSLGTWYSRASGFDGSGKHVVPEFEEAVFKLKDGQVSGLIKTDYGIHIIKRDSSKTVDPASEREEVRKVYKKLYLESDKKAFLDETRKSFGFKIDEEIMRSFLANVDTNKTNLDSAWFRNLPPTLYGRTFYTLLGKETQVVQFMDMLKTHREVRGFGLNREGIRNSVDKITEPIVFDKATENLEQEYPEFSSMMREFRDGILLFRVEALEVWDKLKFDTTLAKVYFDTTKQKYKTQPAYEISEIYVLSDSLAKDIYKQAKDGANFETLAEKYTQRNGYREKKGNWGKLSSRDNKLAQMALKANAQTGQVLEPQPYEKGFSIIKVNKFEPVRPKTFEEAIPDFAPEFQDIMQKNLTEKWLLRIRNEYPVKVNTTALDKSLNEYK